MNGNQHFFGGDPEQLASKLETLAHDIRALAAGNQPDLAGAPVLDNFAFSRRATTALGGHVSGHPLLADHGGAVTSEIFALAADYSWARTFSRFYILGSPQRPTG